MPKVSVVTAVLLALGMPAAAYAEKLNVRMTGYEEVPALSSTAAGHFAAKIDKQREEVEWVLSYDSLEGTVTQAHIHIGQKSVNGPITIFLCSNLGNGPAGTQGCPASPATIGGVITANDVLANAQGIEAGALEEVLAAIRTGAAYVNVHSTKWPGGEVRGQLPGNPGHKGH